jgi:hypothetical protein
LYHPGGGLASLAQPSITLSQEVNAIHWKKPPRNDVIARVKGEKFKEKDIAQTYERLDGAGLFD